MLKSCAGGQPFPLVDPNEPEVARKVIWNVSFRLGFTGDFDIRDVETDSYLAGQTSSEPVDRIRIGHLAFYSIMGRTEVNPLPTDPDFLVSNGIRYRFAAYAFLEPTEMPGFGIVRLTYWTPS